MTVDSGCLSKEGLRCQYRYKLYRITNLGSIFELKSKKPLKDWVDEFEMFTICMLPRLDPDDEDAGSMAEE